MHYIYVLKYDNKDFYIGYSMDLRRRFGEHQKEKICELVYYEAYLSQKIAKNRERKLKHYGSAWRALRERLAA